MNSIDLKHSVVVFDLDDTIYPEADYVESGICFISQVIKELYRVDIKQELIEAYRKDTRVDWLQLACSLANLPPATTQSLLWMYRLHKPSIELTDSTRQVLESIQSKAKAVAILTDGRCITQKLKLQSLGLGEWPTYISEQYGSMKPSPERYEAIELAYQADTYVYIADNVSKDFIGCNPRGWLTIGMKGSLRNIHQQVDKDLPAIANPKLWVSSWQELSLLFK